VAGGFVVVLVVVAGAWWWLGSESGPPGDWEPSPFPPADTAEPMPAPSDREPPEALELPDLNASDEFVRRLVSGLSSHPRLAAYLVGDELVRRFVRTVAELAGGQYPGEHLPALRPEAPFSVREEGGRTVIAPESYRRYDLLAATVQSLDADGTARLFLQLRPLVDDAWEELGAPGAFDEALALAFDNLAAVRFPPEPVEVVEVEGVWVYRDAEFEARRGAAKALVRMGSENGVRIQRKLAELRGELEGYGVGVGTR
jgi:hypothetical protein